MTDECEEPEELELLSGWSDLADDFDIFKLKRIKYVPNPKPSVIYNALHTTTPLPTLTSEDIEPAKEKYQWNRIRTSQYIHIVELAGHFNRPDLSRSNIKKAYRTIKGYKLDLKLPRSVWRNKKGYEGHSSYYGSKGCFFVIWRRNCWEGKTNKPYLRPYSVKLIIKPKMRQNIWTSTVWIEEVITLVEKEYCYGRLRMDKIELPIDLKLGKWDYKSLEPCLWRSFSGEAYRDLEKTGNTIYDGRYWKGKKNKLYIKDGWWHLEPTWHKRAFAKKELKHFSRYMVLLSLIHIYESVSLRYLDIERLVRSDVCRDKALGYWRIFLAQGLRAASKWIKREYANVQRFHKDHPLNSHFKETMANAIEAGLELAGNLRGTPPAGKTVKEVLDNRALRIKLKKKVARRSVR